MEKLFASEPLELEYLYSVLKDFGEVRLYDGQVSGKGILREVRRFRPDLVLITSMITNIGEVCALAARIKKEVHPPLVFVGGPHAEVLPEHYFAPGIDVIFYRGQLTAVREVVRLIGRGESFHHVPGIAWSDGLHFTLNDAPETQSFPVPLPERPLLHRHRHRYRVLWYRDCALLKASWGCPEKCSFCFCREMNGGKYSVRPVEEIVAEMESLPVQNLFIVDDNFLIGPERMRRFCEELTRRGIRKQWIVYGTTAFIARHPALMATLKEAGLVAVIAGFEFIRDADLLDFGKGSAAADNLEAIRICRQLNIDLVSLFMVRPEWPVERFRELSRYVRQNRLCLSTFGTVTPLPGTSLWKPEPRGEHPPKWWRYDLVRLHTTPAHMSPLAYYLRLSYLYMSPAFSKGNLKYYLRKAGWKETLRLICKGVEMNLDFLMRLAIWH